ncbi:hypothetical protein CDL15_Pgr025987 [Punica granatum]|uniref:Uncharacterized protein n=1 Tax=Punica granatum TaxID=22663 RepID=A0A218WB80_PUNGR|nr:hypothetical protein CDL15_Pgr025987 [Punica granatum]PKI40330.1 hypothetical protein CRG98_039285 [Punica granatum]
MLKGGDYEMTKTADEKPLKPKARPLPKRGAVKVRIFKLLGEKLVSLCQCVCSGSPPMVDLERPRPELHPPRTPQ